MLRLILGRAGSGKTEYVRQMLCEKLLAGERDLLLIVPEQFSFETEREMLKKVGASRMQNLDILTFSRLAETVLAETGRENKPKITDGMRAVMMRLALDSLEDTTEIYRKYKSRTPLLQSLVTFSTELKQCAVSADALETAGSALPDGLLKQKLTELSQITALYKALVHECFSDDTDLLTELEAAIIETDCLNGKTVVFDTFAGFTKQERAVIAAMLPRCLEVYITLCTEGKESARQNACVFDNINDEMEKLKRVAAEQNVAVAKPVVLAAAPDSRPLPLRFLEQNLYACRKPRFDGEQNCISLYSAANRREEADFVACTVRKLLREGTCRARDILVLERRKDTYDNELCAAFHKYEIPYFEDKRQPVDAQPLMRFVTSLLEIAADGMTTETLLRALKTGLLGLADDDVSELETYAAVWGIDRGAWKTDFTDNPSGLGRAMQERDEQKLAKLNDLRRRAVEPILQFCADFRPANGAQKSEMLYRFLRKNGVDEALKKLALSLSAAGYPEAAEEQDTVWQMLMEIFNALYLAVGEAEISASRYKELFKILLDSADLGQLPHGLDVVHIAAADRVRQSPPRMVFAVGVNDGVFPENPPTDGVLNDDDRKVLSALGVELTETAEVKAVDERFFVYSAFTMPTERLFVSWAVADYKGGSLSESAAVRELRALFPGLPETASATVLPEERLEGAAASFEACAEHYCENTPLSATLKAYFSNMPEFWARLAAVDKTVKNAEIQFENPQNSTALFGENMLVSASKAEVYYKCPFSYFCKFGLHLKPLKKAELDVAQSGTVIHHCLEVILRAYDRDTLLSFADEDLRATIAETITQYAKENMGTAVEDSRFAFLLRNLEKSVLDVLNRLLSEFQVSDFIPTAFELSIAPDGEIAPYCLDLPDGGALRVIGSVDRVDTMVKDGKTYLRVVDYKSGGKAFNLSEVFSGLNMQMLIYLFAVCENGKDRFVSPVPAGVLYLPAKTIEDKLPRNAETADILSAKLRNSRMQGVVLDSTDAVHGMDKTVSGKYIPVTLKKNGEFTGNLLSLPEFTALKDKVDDNLKQMGALLHEGVIPVLPAYSKKDNIACKYCDYAAICGYEEGDRQRQLADFGRFDSARKVLQEIQKGETAE
ncbi:MAG: PD-(D/E)XK nuclease family protein [Candidatus Fimenecus sp.]